MPGRSCKVLFMKTTRRNVSVLALGSLLVGTLVTGCNKYEDQALTAVRANRNDVQNCITEAAQRNPNVSGDMELALEVAPNGKINRLGMPKDEAKDPLLTECVKQRAANWQLPAPPSGKMETVKYKFRVGKG